MHNALLLLSIEYCCLSFYYLLLEKETMNLLIKNIKQLVTVSAGGKRFKTGPEMNDLGIVENGTVLIENGKISWAGRTADFDRSVPDSLDTLDAEGLVALPGFVEIRVKFIAGFMPLYAGIASPRQARRLVREHLLNPKEFWLRYPVATYAGNKPRLLQWKSQRM